MRAVKKGEYSRILSPIGFVICPRLKYFEKSEKSVSNFILNISRYACLTGFKAASNLDLLEN